jgi:copper chaperone CopZ
VSVAIKKLDGVASVEVSLNGGFADVKLKPGNRIDPERIRQLVRDNGFTPKAADVTLAGRIVARDGTPALEIPEHDVVYVLVEHPDAKGSLAEARRMTSKSVLVTARLPETDVQSKTGARPLLELRSVQVR